jgi:internalin A
LLGQPAFLSMPVNALLAWLSVCVLVFSPVVQSPSKVHAHRSLTQVRPETATELTAGQVVASPELVHTRLRSKNPEYQNQARFALDPSLGLVGDVSAGGVHDLSPLQGIPFRALNLKGARVSDLTPLKGMPLVLLGLEDTDVADLGPLAGMKLEKLYLSNTAVADLRPLSGMPLKELMLVETGVKDLRPLRGAPIQLLWLNEAPVSDVSPLSQCPLISITLEGTGVSDLRPLAGMAGLQRLHIGRTGVRDLSPLRGLKLSRLIFSPAKIESGLDVVRGMKTLTELGTMLENRMPPQQFWQLYDQGGMR